MGDIDAEIEEAEGRLFAKYDITPRRRTIEMGSQRTRLRILEVGEGPPVLLLHAGSLFGAAWAPQLARLRGYRLLAPDLPGHGLSGAVDYRGVDLRKKFVSDFTGMLDALQIDQAAVVGNSMGGMYGLWSALGDSTRVTRLAVVGVPGVVLPGVRGDLSAVLVSTPGLNRFLLRLPTSARLSRAAFKPALKHLASQRANPELYEIHCLTRRRPEAVLSFSTMMERMVRWKTPRPELAIRGDELARLRIPTRFLFGDADVLGGREIADDAARYIADARVHSISGGHFLGLDQPDECTRLLSEFLSES